MRVHVAFTPVEAIEAHVGVVVDVMRATSTITQALASGYPRVLAAPGIDEARGVREALGGGLLGGERNAVRIEGFDAGASPREFLDGRDVPVIFSTTNGTRAILTAVQHCDEVLLGSLLNVSAVARAVRERGRDATIVCAGFQGAFAIDDAYCAGRIVALVDGSRTDAAVASEVIARTFPNALDGLNARTYGPPGLEDDLAWCSQVDTVDVVPRFTRMVGAAAELAL